MKYFFDTEFIESSERKTIDLISIGIVAEDGRKYYAISTEFDPSLASEWVRDNVLSKLPPRPGTFNPAEALFSTLNESKAWTSLANIREEILKFTSQDVTPIEFWADYGAYDWVVFCWIFGCMVDLPNGYPYNCNDINQWTTQLGLSRDFLPPEPIDAHNALADAQWTKEAYDALKQYSDNQQSRRSDGKPVELKDGSH